MEKLIKRYNIAITLLTFVGLPLLIIATGNFSERTFLKDSLSIITILSFSAMLLQFFLTRSNDNVLKVYKMKSVIKVHKIIGYVFIPVLLLHPFFVVLPRYFEAGTDPVGAFVLLITSFGSKGIVLGVVAWGLMLLIGITALIRKNMAIAYKTWRIFHGVLCMLFIGLASWHAIDMGRHSNSWMSGFVVIMAGIGILLLARVYFFKNSKKSED